MAKLAWRVYAQYKSMWGGAEIAMIHVVALKSGEITKRPICSARRVLGSEGGDVSTTLIAQKYPGDV